MDTRETATIAQLIDIIDQLQEENQIPDYLRVNAFNSDHGHEDPLECAVNVLDGLDTIRGILIMLPGVKRAVNERRE